MPVRCLMMYLSITFKHYCLIGFGNWNCAVLVVHCWVCCCWSCCNLLSHWDPYAMHRGGCLELYYCNMVEWSWWDSSLIWKTNWFPAVLWHCWFGHMTCKNCPRNDLSCVEWDVKPLHYYYSCWNLTKKRAAHGLWCSPARTAILATWRINPVNCGRSDWLVIKIDHTVCLQVVSGQILR